MLYFMKSLLSPAPANRKAIRCEGGGDVTILVGLKFFAMTSHPQQRFCHFRSFNLRLCSMETRKKRNLVKENMDQELSS